MKKLLPFIFMFFGVYHTLTTYNETKERSVTLAVGIPLSEIVSVSVEYNKMVGRYEPGMTHYQGDKFFSNGRYGRDITIGLEWTW
jgi:hypothetical protein